MSRKKIINIISVFIASFIIVGLLIYTSISSQQKIDLNKKRIVNSSISKISDLDLQDNFDNMKIINDTVFFVSWKKENKGKFFFFNKKSNNIEEYSKFKGNISIKDFYYYNNKFIYADNNTSTLIKMNDKEDYSKINIDKPITRGILINNDFVFSSWDNNFNMIFYKFNLLNNTQSSIQFNNRLFKDNIHTGISCDGLFVSNTENVLLVPYANNNVFIFDKEMNYVNSLILNFKNPKFEFNKTDKGELVVSSKNLYPNISACTNSNNLYILSNTSGNWDVKDEYFLDVYDIRSKKYVKSYKIEDKDFMPRYIAFDNGKIYTLGKNRLIQYEIK